MAGQVVPMSTPDPKWNSWSDDKSSGQSARTPLTRYLFSSTKVNIEYVLVIDETMEVVDYELYSIPPRWVFLKLKTDTGIIGWGEPALEGHSDTLCSALSELVEDYIIGADPRRLTDLWYRMYMGDHYNNGPVLMSAIAGIDQALWDIKGRDLDKPVYELLGGPVRDKVQLYQWLSGDHPADLADVAVDAVEDGYTTLGLMAHTRPARVRTQEIVSNVEERVSTVRNAVGEGVDLAIDFRGRVSTGVARQLLSMLERYNLMFVEEPVHPTYNENLSELTASTNIPIATGQRMYSRWDFREVLQEQSVDIVQPAISHAGGITEVVNIGKMAEAYNIMLMPKCSVGPVSFAAAMHVQFAVPNAILQEQHDEFYAEQDNEFFNYLATDSPFIRSDGFMKLQERPGLGIEMNESYIREQAEKKTSWKGPTWNYEDGSVANW